MRHKCSGECQAGYLYSDVHLPTREHAAGNAEPGTATNVKGLLRPVDAGAPVSSSKTSTPRNEALGPARNGADFFARLALEKHQEKAVDDVPPKDAPGRSVVDSATPVNRTREGEGKRLDISLTI